MNRRLCFFLKCFLLFGLGVNAAPSVFAQTKTLSLSECYQLALQRSETVAIQQELIKEAEARFGESLSGILPSAVFSSSDERQNGGGQTNFTLRKIPERKFVFHQPLFSGFKEFAALAASRAERRQRIQETLRAQQLLLSDVADAFYLFWGYQEEIQSVETIRSALVQRVDELNKRQTLGRSRLSEVASAESRLSRADADTESVRSSAEVARQLLEFLIGEPVEDLTDDQAFPEPGLEENYLAKVDSRPDVQAAQEAMAVARKQVTIARAGFWPTVGLDGDYYTKRVGNAANVTWDATLQIDVPIFDGGEAWSQVNQAKAQLKEAELRLSQVQRTAVLEIRNAYTQFQRAQRRNAALEKTWQAADKNYQLQMQDYRSNLVNNLDVLQALEDLSTAQQDFIIAKYAAKRFYWSLKVAVGESL